MKWPVKLEVLSLVGSWCHRGWGQRLVWLHFDLFLLLLKP
jgi:hypothetical protein